MKRFSYHCGQRPLDGYTVKRGLGRGGFGEVYLAVSDSGKEVALKVLRGDTDAELRGVGHCLNLKHPNLVALYDPRRHAPGDPWTPMGDVAGRAPPPALHPHTGAPAADLARASLRAR